MKREFKEILLSDIIPTEDNKRKFDKKPDAEDIELLESVKAGGIRQAVQVRPHPDQKGKFELRSGERRYRVALEAGMETIPAIVYTGLSDADAMDLTYIENKFRKNLKPMEEAAEVALLLERFGGNVKAITKRYGINAQWVHVRANIAKGLIKDWKLAAEGKHECLDVRNWTISHLSLIARLPERIQEEFFDYVDNNHWEFKDMSAADLDEMIGKMLHLLSKAKWNLDDETLLPKAGACSKCTKRCGHQPMLWFDSDDQVDAGDQCLDGHCWIVKGLAWLERSAAELRQKHPNMVLVMTEPTRGCDTRAITEKMGAPLCSWQYATCSKTTKGAVPAMYVNNKGAGKLAYIKIKEFSGHRADKAKGTPTPLKKRREMLDAKRWAQVLLDLREKVKGATVADITYKDKVSSVMTLVAAHGNKKLWSPFGYDSWQGSGTKVSKAEISKLVKSKNSQARAIELLWQSFLPTLDDLLTYNGPITQTPKKFTDDAAWITDMIGVDIKLLLKDVSSRKGFTEPKSWAGLNADGTPKKAKPAKKAAAKKKPAVKKGEQEKQICRICGCSDMDACVDEETGEPCHWVEDDLCSKCEYMAVKKGEKVESKSVA